MKTLLFRALVALIAIAVFSLASILVRGDGMNLFLAMAVVDIGLCLALALT